MRFSGKNQQLMLVHSAVDGVSVRFPRRTVSADPGGAFPMWR
jgi:hypothetical protein